jgi:hypothetical protein
VSEPDIPAALRLARAISKATVHGRLAGTTADERTLAAALLSVSKLHDDLMESETKLDQEVDRQVRLSIQEQTAESIATWLERPGDDRGASLAEDLRAGAWRKK